MNFPAGVSCSEVWFDTSKSFLRVITGGEAKIIIDSRLPKIKALFHPGEYEQILASVPFGEVGAIPYTRFAPDVPETWAFFTFVVLGAHPALPVMVQYAFQCSLEKVKQPDSLEAVLYDLLSVYLNGLIREVGGDPAVFFNAMKKLSEGM